LSLLRPSGSKLMRLPFSGRNEKLETMNRILTEAAQKRTERIEELERRVAQLERELETAREAIERAKLLEVVAAERAQLLNEKDKQLADVREVATKYYFRIQELERTLAEIVQKYNVPYGFVVGDLRRAADRSKAEKLTMSKFFCGLSQKPTSDRRLRPMSTHPRLSRRFGYM